jgi:DNA-directed RNA polymerase specialized sigma24 family protein
MKRERDPTPEEFEKLLAWLDCDRDVAGKKYETIRSRLIRIFISRGCVEADRLADEVMNRVAVRIDKLVETYEGDPARCLQGFADKVYLEYLRDQKRRSEVDTIPQPIFPDEREREELELAEREQEDECLTRCMGELSWANSELFRRYFEGEKSARINARKKLAAEFRLTANALRIKAHRIRRRLRQCLEACLNEIRGPETV